MTSRRWSARPVCRGSEEDRTSCGDAPSAARAPHSFNWPSLHSFSLFILYTYHRYPTAPCAPTMPTSSQQSTASPNSPLAGTFKQLRLDRDLHSRTMRLEEKLEDVAMSDGDDVRGRQEGESEREKQKQKGKHCPCLNTLLVFMKRAIVWGCAVRAAWANSSRRGRHECEEGTVRKWHVPD